ncbi:unnamed protein product, partial [Nesidiocoris tenuis]
PPSTLRNVLAARSLSPSGGFTPPVTCREMRSEKAIGNCEPLVREGGSSRWKDGNDRRAGRGGTRRLWRPPGGERPRRLRPFLRPEELPVPRS